MIGGAGIDFLELTLFVFPSIDSSCASSRRKSRVTRALRAGRGNFEHSSGVRARVI